MTNRAADILRRDRIIAWITVILSVVAMVATKSKELLVIGLLLFALLGSLVWILVIGFQLRRANVERSHREAVFWRVAFLGAFAMLNIYLCFYYGLNNWKAWWGNVVIAILCMPAAVLLWRDSTSANYPLYAVTVFLGVGVLVSGIYGYAQNRELLQLPIKSQITGWLIPALPTALLINCCLYVRRKRERQSLETTMNPQV